jgi:recombination DNA repair RAD52 pathway protein
MALTEKQLEQLFKPINLERVQITQGHANLEAWDVIAHLTRIFGFMDWDKEIDCELIFETQRDPSKPGGWDVAYRAKCRLTVRDAEEFETVHEDVATGDAQNQPSRADAHDLAIKAAASTALKRAAKDLGNQFGLSLYKKMPGNKVAVSVVGRSLAHVLEPDDSIVTDPEEVRERVGDLHKTLLGERDDAPDLSQA